MKIEAEKSSLVRILSAVQGVVLKRTSMPVLSNGLLVAEGSSLSVAATDLDMYLRLSADVDVVERGSVALPARELLNRVKAMPDGVVLIHETPNNEVMIKAKTSSRSFTMNAWPVDEFPVIPEPTADVQEFSLGSSTIGLLIHRTMFSASKDETRARINGAFLSLEKTTARMVTTDGHRLTQMEAKIDCVDTAISMLLPLKAVSILAKLANRLGGVVTIRKSDSNVFFAMGSTTFSTKLVREDFPAYGRCIPKPTQKCVRVNRSDLIDSARAMMLASDDDAIAVSFDVSGNTLHIVGSSRTRGDGADELAVSNNAESMRFRINPQYLIDCLEVLECDDVCLQNAGSAEPVVVLQFATNDHSDFATSDDFICAAMPML